MLYVRTYVLRTMCLWLSQELFLDPQFSLYKVAFSGVYTRSAGIMISFVHGCLVRQFSLVASAHVHTGLLEAQVPSCRIGAGTHVFA